MLGNGTVCQCQAMQGLLALSFLTVVVQCLTTSNKMISTLIVQGLEHMFLQPKSQNISK